MEPDGQRFLWFQDERLMVIRWAFSERGAAVADHRCRAFDGL